MRSNHTMKSLAVIAVGVLAVSIGSTSALAQAAAPAGELPPDREEIVITHQKMGPLSDWASMQEHSAEYNRLKAKFDPSQGSSHTDNWASDRALASHNGSGDSFMQESAQAPTPPAVQAVKDAIVPP
jgi:hypothetical protein